MALFDESVEVRPVPRRRRPRGTVAGIWALIVALGCLLALTFLPTSFVIQRPGPVFNTLGKVPASDGTEVPLIEVDGAATYPTGGTLDLTTVQTIGSPARTPSWFELAMAWFDPARAVIPLDVAYPAGQTSEERDEQGAAMMIDSQKEATAAALRHLGYDVHPHLRVHALSEDSASAGILQEGDVIVQAEGQDITDGDTLRKIINDGEGAPVSMRIDRGGTLMSVEVTPKQVEVDGETRWLIGVILITDYEFPFDVTIQLDNVGGPSAGMMFALGIIDTLTPGKLNGGKDVAGTGTITGTGEVGPIGGIRQKLFGARDAGAEYFLAPEQNCDEVYGHVPAGMQVVSVDDLDDALTALDEIAAGGDLHDLPTCTAADAVP